MNSIQSVFAKKAGFVGYLTGGDGGIQYSIEAGLALLEGGVDLLEIGVPFSDPIADGATIQKACIRALKNGTQLDSILEIGATIKRYAPSAPLILFSYFNPLLQANAGFTLSAKQAGFDGMLLLDLPFDSPFYEEHSELDPIFIVSPSTSSLRLEQITQKAKGFLYYACQKGTTGVRQTLPSDLVSQIQRIKKVTQLPTAVGFGIADRETAKKVTQCADGFVVGSAFVKMIEEGASPKELRNFALKIDPRNGCEEITRE